MPQYSDYTNINSSGAGQFGNNVSYSVLNHHDDLAAIGDYLTTDARDDFATNQTPNKYIPQVELGIERILQGGSGSTYAVTHRDVVNVTFTNTDSDVSGAPLNNGTFDPGEAKGEIVFGQATIGFSKFLGVAAATARTLNNSDPDADPTFPDQHGDIWINVDHQSSTWSSQNIWTEDLTHGYESGGVAYANLMHEICHALGLGHPVVGGAIDNQKYSIMSYVPFGGTGNSAQVTGIGPMIDTSSITNSAAPKGLQMFDILVLQEAKDSNGNYIYGRNYSTRASGDEYTKTSAFASHAAHDTFIYTIWDGGGVDRIDVSGYEQSAKIDLRQGAFSSIGADVSNNALFVWTPSIDPNAVTRDMGNLAIAYYTVIEEAIGTKNHDLIIGNAWDNKLEGGEGNDFIFGDGYSYDQNTGFLGVDDGQGGYKDDQRAWNSTTNLKYATDFSGADTLIGGKGNDFLHGGAGLDWASYAEDVAPKGVKIELDALGNGAATDGWGDTDTLRSIENIALGAGKNEVSLTGAVGRTITGAVGSDDTVIYNGAVVKDPNDPTKIWDINGTVFDTLQGIEKVEIIDGTITPDFTQDTLLASGNIYNYSTYSGSLDIDFKGYVDRLYIGSPYADIIRIWKTKHIVDLEVQVGGHTHGFEYESQRSRSTVSMQAALDEMETYYVQNSHFSIIGSNYGDTVNILAEAPNAYQSITFTGGHGNDHITLHNRTGQFGRVDIGYRGGNDRVENGEYVNSLILWEGIKQSDVTTDLSGGNYTLSYSNIFGTGSIRLEGVTSAPSLVFLNNTNPGVLPGLDGDDVLGTHPGEDMLVSALDGNDTIYSANGNNTVLGGLGNDTYVYGGGYDIYGDDLGLDTVSVAAFALKDEASFEVTDSGTTISFYNGATDNDGAVFLSRHIAGGNGAFESLEFLEGTPFDLQAFSHIQIVKPNGNPYATLTLTATNPNGELLIGDNLPEGYSGETLLYGGSGNDILWDKWDYSIMQGGLGDDLYVIQGYSQKSIIDYSGNTLIFADDITLDIFDWEDNGNGNISLINTDSESTFAYLSVNNSKTLIVLEDGTVIPVADLIAGTPVFFTPTSGNNVINASLSATTSGLTMGLGAGNDTFTGKQFSLYADRINGEAGDDTLYGYAGEDVLIGGDGNDTLYGGSENDVLRGGAGLDILNGGSGVDILDGGLDGGIASYADATMGISINLETKTTAFGHAGNSDVLINITGVEGSNYQDTIRDSRGNDTLRGLGGNDSYYYSSGADYIEDTSGTDTVYFGSTWIPQDLVITGHVINLGQGFDQITFSNINSIEFFDFNNYGVLTLSQLQTLIQTVPTRTGTSGDDIFTGEDIAENFSGLDGVDTVDYSDSDWSVDVDLLLSNGYGGDAEGDNFSSIENVIGSNLSFAADYIIGNSESNHFQGLAGDDYLEGAGGADILDGGEGLDTAVYVSSAVGVEISLASETASGGDATGDTLISIENLSGSTYNDVLTGNEQENILWGSLGDDTLVGGGGDDLLDGDAGFDDAVFEGAYAQYIITQNVGSVLVEDQFGTEGTDTLFDVERLLFLDGVYENSIFTAYSQDDTFFATSVSETFDGGDGSDRVDYSNSDAGITLDLQNNTSSGGYAQGDTLISIENITGTSYDDTIFGEASNNIISGGDGVDTLRGRAGEDVLFGGDGNDYLRGDEGNDYIDGGDGVDKLRGGTGDDTLYAGAGNDQDVNAEAGNDTLYGEDGDDKLRGGADDDVLFGGNGNDFLYGDTDDLDTTGGNDILDGGAGDDSLRGGYGNDIYVASDGIDDINDLGGVDTISYGVGVSIHDLSIEAVSGDVNDIAIILGANQILIENQLDTSGNLVIEKLGFADGSTATLARVADWVYTSSSGGTTTGLSVADTIIGDVGNDTINGLAGNDELFGGGGNDSLRGGEGDDQLHGGSGVNTAIFSGAYSNYVFSGNTIEDTVGTDGTDTFFNIQSFKFYDGTYESGVFTPSSTDDTLTATAAADVLDGGAGSDTADYSGSNAAIDIDLLNGTANGGYARGDSLISIENVIGSAYGDTLAGDANNNALSGGLGGDTYVYTGGLDTIADTGGADTLVLANATVHDASFAFDGDDLVITINAGTNEVRITDQAITASGIELIRFSDGFEASLSAINSWVFSSTSVHGSNGVDDTIILGSADHTSYGYSGNDRIHGGAGADILRGNEGADMIFGGAGNDDLKGDDGDDVVDGGDGVDKLRGGLGNDILNAGAGDDTDVRAEEGDDFVYGGAGNDTIYGDYNSTDSITGNDTLDGGDGNDSLYGGLGNDTYIASNGADYVNDRGGADAIRFGAGISIFDLSFANDPGDTNDQIITFGSNTIQVENQTESSGAYTVETLLFADGTYANFANILDWDFATAGGGTIHGSYSEDDTMIGNVGNDSFYGKDGNDQLFGGDGDDYLRGGNDTEDMTGGDDILVGGAGNDDMKGDDGNDMLYAGTGADRLEGGTGADSYIFQGAEIVDGNLNRVVGFSQAEGDVLILEDVLQGYDPLIDALSDFITMHTTSHTYLSIDVDGKGEAFDMVADVIRLEGITVWSSVQDMITQGDLLVA